MKLVGVAIMIVAIPASGFTCTDWCKSGGHGDFGQIIGTAPFCSASCNSDCPNGSCELATSEMSDYGHGCATGDKVCCCSGTVSSKVAVKEYKEQEKKTMDIATATSFSCSDWCKSGGHGDFGQIIGTAPFCGASCNSDCPNGSCETATSEMSDYGHGCATGNKVCCCSGKSGEKDGVSVVI